MSRGSSEPIELVNNESKWASSSHHSFYDILFICLLGNEKWPLTVFVEVESRKCICNLLEFFSTLFVKVLLMLLNVT